MKLNSRKVFLALLMVSISTSALAQDSITLPMEEYDPQTLESEKDNTDLKWDLMKLKSDNLTKYSLITDEKGNKVIKAIARKSASGLVYYINIDPKKFQTIEWRWKVDGVWEKGDLRNKDGDDYPARIYITFDYDKSNLRLGDRIKYAAIKAMTSYRVPLRSINYIWANKAEKGTVAPNPFTDWVQMIAVQSGNNKAGMWMSGSRNIYEDYKKAFGEEPPNIDGVAIMTDSDNTQGNAVAYYGDIIFRISSEDKTNSE